MEEELDGGERGGEVMPGGLGYLPKVIMVMLLMYSYGQISGEYSGSAQMESGREGRCERWRRQWISRGIER
jgi:hypothetical protein